MYATEHSGALDLGERVRIARAIFGVSQQALAQRLGVSQARICQLERGELRDQDLTRSLVNEIVLAGAERSVEGTA